MAPYSFWRTIRGKIAVGSGLFLAILLLMGSIAHYELGRIERATRLIDMVDDLRSEVLEMRRYEKNLQLFPGREGDLDALRGFAGLARVRAAAVGQAYAGAMDHREGDGTRRLEALLQGIMAYEKLLAVVPPDAAALTVQGQHLSELADAVVRQMRQGIFTVVSQLRGQLLAVMGALLACGLLFAWQAGRRVLRALRAIEAAARAVGQGKAALSPPEGLEEEARHVLLTLDQMAAELEKRHALLLQEKKLASLGVLSSGVAHQLNNPLNNIYMGCQLLREDVSEAARCGSPLPTPADMAAQLDDIGAEVLRARDIVRGLLDFTRDAPFAVARHNLAQVARKAVALVRHDMGPGVRVEMDVPDDMELIMDAGRIQEMLINLLLNAAQAMAGQKRPTGVASAADAAEQGRIRISARSETALGMAELCVEDNGPGIAPEFQGRVFDPFFSLKPVGEGTGLGLSIVFGIVRKHRGHISVESAPGQGCRFTVRLPLRGPEGERHA